MYHVLRTRRNQTSRNRQRQECNIDMQLRFLHLIVVTIGIMQLHLLRILPRHARRHLADLRDPSAGIALGYFGTSLFDFRAGSVVDFRVRFELEEEVTGVHHKQHNTRAAR